MIPAQTDRIEASFSKQAVNISTSIVHSLRKEFNLPENEIDNFVTFLIEKAVADRVSETNSKVFSDSEVKELEEDLKGLGYI